eukprot:SAG11_NODE_1217_length_5498_cov_3.519444_5_plen_311_part_00
MSELSDWWAGTGIGLATTEALARANASVLIAAYKIAHGQEAAVNVSRLTGNPHVSALAIDLSNLTSVRAFAGRALATLGRIDVLINDASIADPIPGLAPITDDGLERVIATNYVGHFLLTELLLPALRASPQGRVISVSSYAMNVACLAAKRLPTCLSGEANWHRDATTATPNATNYGVSKFMQTAHMDALALRESAAGSPVRAYSLHPGMVETAMSQGRFTDTVCKAMCVLDMQRVVPKCKPGVCPLRPIQAAATPTFLATRPGADLMNGGYYFLCEPAKKGAALGWSWERDPAQLYEASRRWAGLASW